MPAITCLRTARWNDVRVDRGLVRQTDLRLGLAESATCIDVATNTILSDLVALADTLCGNLWVISISYLI